MSLNCAPLRLVELVDQHGQYVILCEHFGDVGMVPGAGVMAGMDIASIREFQAGLQLGFHLEPDDAMKRERSIAICPLRRARPRLSVEQQSDMTTGVAPEEYWRPVAVVTMQDPIARARIVDLLERAGWVITPQPTGFHLVQAIAGVIEGDQPWLRPKLIIVDAWSRGCAGTTIAAGLRDLGITIPIVLIARSGEALPISADDTLRIVDSEAAESAVAELIRHQRSMSNPHPSPQGQ